MTEVTGSVLHEIITDDPREERPLVRRLRSGTALLLGLGLVGLLVGWGYGVRQGATQEATAAVLVSPLEGNPFSPSGSGSDLVNLETEAQLVRSDTVADDVIADLGLDVGATELLEDVTVEVPSNTQILRISVTHPSGSEAVRRAQAVADSFLEFRQTRARTAAGVLADQITEQIDRQQDEIEQRTGRLGQLDPGSGRAVLLRQQIVEATTQLGELRAQLAALEATRADPGEVVTPAALPPTGLLASVWTWMLLGLAAGVSAAVVVLAVRARRDGRIRGVADLEDIGVPVLGEITDGGGGADMATSVVRSAVLALLPQRPLVLGMVSIGEEVHVADELAWSMARARHTVAHVALSGPGDDREGLSDLLLGVAPVDDVLRPITSNLARMTCGSSQDRLPDLLGSPDMSDVVAELGRRADVVVLDAGAAGGLRARALVRHAHGVVIEVHSGISRLADLAEARSLVWAAGGQVIGVVLVQQARRGPLGRG